MNFFQAQDKARKKTWQLGLMFTAAVITLIVLTNVLVALVFGFGGSQLGLSFQEAIARTPPDAWLWISVGVIGVVAAASGYKYLSIQGGGKAIAESLGGSLIHQSTRDPKQRRLLNVVEEMAIASGTPVPPVYLIPEPSINAFAAGFSTQDAVIGINQGTLDHLDRGELQGVVAHEFSHILNGDTGINLRLIAILHGILFLGMIGYGILRVGGYSRSRNAGAAIALGVGLLVIGYGGTFFGNMIKSAVSRQREYLADASAVQFTRDPSSIADALKKIGGLSYGSAIESRGAQEASHMFFGSISSKLGGLMSTHPPLDKRIRAIDPRWDGKFPNVGSGAASSSFQDRAGMQGFAASNVSHVDVTPEGIVDLVGQPTEASLEVAHELIEETDELLKNAAHDPYEARALVYAMLLDQEPDIRSQQMAYVAENAEQGVPPHVTRLIEHVDTTDKLHLLTLLDMAIPALKELSHGQYKRFSANAAQLITTDRRVDVFEWVLHRVLMSGLHAHFEKPFRSHGSISSVGRVEDEAAKLLSILASHSHVDFEAQMAAYEAGARELGIETPYAKQEHFDYKRMNDALGKLRELKPLVKPSVIKACAATVLADDHVNLDEGALLQGIAATLDCPLPANTYA